ncbi:Sphinganine C(4)-monooxygenase 2 [Apostasia shenzhenica]|uniref:Sphinganine C(4)-monooxygenase 2 n=1 Tax=Apostasia shenzhenica TaxID=1088818 RepID=A0A2I0B5R6_9ASPA|nr:Sphinganine C(4)-monooxygenase 2 [Apostasia shenzhenica]
MVTLVPITVYWMCSGVYLVLERKNDYRLHTKAEEDAKNTVFKGVVLQQIFQIIISLATLRVNVS